jgi:hypothetical protein
MYVLWIEDISDSIGGSDTIGGGYQRNAMSFN